MPPGSKDYSEATAQEIDQEVAILVKPGPPAGQRCPGKRAGGPGESRQNPPGKRGPGRRGTAGDSEFDGKEQTLDAVVGRSSVPAAIELSF